MPTRDQIRSATFCRIEQLSLLVDLRDGGPSRLYLMDPHSQRDGRHRNYDICGLEILPWVLAPEKGWVSVSDRNLYAITPAGIAAIAEWEIHQFDKVDVRVMEPRLTVRPEPTAHLRALPHDQMWPQWAAEWDRGRRRIRRRASRPRRTSSN